MDTLIDFEELIDLDMFFPKIETPDDDASPQAEEPLIDVLDKMCDAMDENNITYDEDKLTITFDTTKEQKVKIIDDIVDLDEFEFIFNEVCDTKDNSAVLKNEDGIFSKEIVESVQKYSENLNCLSGTELLAATNVAAVTTEHNISNGIENNEYVKLETNSTNTLKTIACQKETDFADNKIFELDAINISCKVEDKKLDIGDLKTVIIEKIKDTEVLSISSEDVCSISDDGYNSSDFEFISETEAKKEGLSIKTKPKTDNSTKPLDAKKLNETNAKKINPNDDFIKYHRNRYLRCFKTLRPTRENHIIPEGDNYLDLFRGMRAPAVMNNMWYATNKHVIPVKSMSTTTDGFGFNLPMNRFEANNEDKEDANETIKKIRYLYPDENRKRPRRF